jgi:hypothetical protein
MCVVPVQMPNVPSTWTPFDVCLSCDPLRSRGASQSEIRQIHRGWHRFFRLCVGLAGMETSVPAGTVTPLENVNGRSARRLTATGETGCAYQHFVLERRESNGQRARPSIR